MSGITLLLKDIYLTCFNYWVWIKANLFPCPKEAGLCTHWVHSDAIYIYMYLTIYIYKTIEKWLNGYTKTKCHPPQLLCEFSSTDQSSCACGVAPTELYRGGTVVRVALRGRLQDRVRFPEAYTGKTSLLMWPPVGGRANTGPWTWARVLDCLPKLV